MEPHEGEAAETTRRADVRTVARAVQEDGSVSRLITQVSPHGLDLIGRVGSGNGASSIPLYGIMLAEQHDERGYGTSLAITPSGVDTVTDRSDSWTWGSHVRHDSEDIIPDQLFDKGGVLERASADEFKNRVVERLAKIQEPPEDLVKLIDKLKNPTAVPPSDST